MMDKTQLNKEKDSKRLDWLEKNARVANYMGRSELVIPLITAYPDRYLRQAIDTAMAKEEE